MAATLHSDSDVNSSKALLTQQQDWLQELNGRIKHTHARTLKDRQEVHMHACVMCEYEPWSSALLQQRADVKPTHLVLEGGWLHHLQGSAVHLDQAVPPLAVGNCCGGFLRKQSGTILLSFFKVRNYKLSIFTTAHQLHLLSDCIRF